jgi:hypothetical protein
MNEPRHASDDAAIDAILGPLRSQLAEIDSLLVANTTERDSLRARRVKVAAILRAAGDTLPGKPGPKKTRDRRRATQGRIVAEETVAKVLDLIDKAAPNGDTFTTRQVRGHKAWQTAGFSRATLDNAVHVLHQDGVLALEHVAANGERTFRRARR